MTQGTETPDAQLARASGEKTGQEIAATLNLEDLGAERLLRLGGLAARAFAAAAMALPAATAELGGDTWAEMDAASVEAWGQIAAAGEADLNDDSCYQPCLSAYAEFIAPCALDTAEDAVALLGRHAALYGKVLVALDGATFADLAVDGSEALERLGEAAEILARLTSAGSDLAAAAPQHAGYLAARFDEVLAECEERLENLEAAA